MVCDWWVLETWSMLLCWPIAALYLSLPFLCGLVLFSRDLQTHMGSRTRTKGYGMPLQNVQHYTETKDIMTAFVQRMTFSLFIFFQVAWGFLLGLGELPCGLGIEFSQRVPLCVS